MNKKIILYITIITISFFFLISFSKFGVKKEKNIILDYSVTRNLKYNVNLYENNFITDLKQQEDKTYISELVKNIDMNFKYDYIIKNNQITDFRYRIVGNVISKYEDELEVWNREIVYKESDIYSTNSKLSIDESIVIDYKELTNAVVAFKQQFNMPTSTIYQVRLIVNADGLSSFQDIVLCEFEIDKQAFFISKDFKDKDDKKITKDIKSFSVINFILSIIEVFLILFFVYKLIKLYFLSINSLSDYEKKIKKILNHNNEIIIEVLTPIKINNEVIVKDFNQLLDIEFESKIPINLYQTKNKALFYILLNNVTYTYTIKK